MDQDEECPKARSSTQPRLTACVLYHRVNEHPEYDWSVFASTERTALLEYFLFL